MQSFLKEKRGFCEQFAATYAAMARSIGIPARVVVGFTPGEPDANGRFTITNEQAHSWVEVYISNFGWLTIDPTPSGPLPGQAPTSIGQVVTTTTTTSTSIPATQPGTTTPQTTVPDKNKVNSESSKDSSYITFVVATLSIVAAVIAIFILRRRKRGSRNDDEYIVDTFREIGQKVLDLTPQPDLTIAELVERVPESNETIREFLALLTLASYAPKGEVTWKDVRLAATKARSEKIDTKK